MPKTAPIPECSAEDRQVLESWAANRTMEARLVERARIVLGCIEGKSVNDVAENLNVRPNTVIDWRRRFEAEGVAGAAGSAAVRKAGTIHREVSQASA